MGAAHRSVIQEHSRRDLARDRRPGRPRTALRADPGQHRRPGPLGELPVGYRLPTVRGFAEQLGLAANTVAKAYRALETDGVIETRGRNGTFIAAPGDTAEREAAAAARGYAERARRLGLDRAAALAAAEEAVRAVYGA
ncbi:hypothetical protein GCM10020221_30210 [Streptomyces thioluteus]|uniref:HTH gntR-type domain-containing protein n=1 Tax=Streptomyces thioluteus TaxID=66431 RepID=A0ABN3WYV5_STRTU